MQTQLFAPLYIGVPLLYKYILTSDFASTIDVKRPVGEALGEIQSDTTLPLPVIARIIPLSEVERLKVLNKPCERLNRGVKRINS